MTEIILTFASEVSAWGPVLCGTISVRDKFRSGGAEVSCPNNFHCLHVNQVVLPEYYLIFPPENGYLKILGGAGAAGPLSPMGRTPMCGTVSYVCQIQISNI